MARPKLQTQVTLKDILQKPNNDIVKSSGYSALTDVSTAGFGAPDGTRYLIITEHDAINRQDGGCIGITITTDSGTTVLILQNSFHNTLCPS